MADGLKRTVVVSAAAGVATPLLAANSNRMAAIILNNSAGVVYVGPTNTVAAATGLPLAAGASISDTTSGDAWYVFNGQAGAADMRMLETAEPT